MLGAKKYSPPFIPRTACQSGRASAASLARVLVLPWMIFLGLLAAIAAISSFGTRPGMFQWFDENGSITAGFIIAIVIDVICATWARNRLLNNLREVATQRFDLRRPESPPPKRQPPPVRLATPNPAGAV